MNPLSVALERALIEAGAWWPGLFKVIKGDDRVRNMDKAAFNSENSGLEAIVESYRVNHPERFLPGDDMERLRAIEDPAERYAQLLQEIVAFQERAEENLSRMRRVLGVDFYS